MNAICELASGEIEGKIAQAPGKHAIFIFTPFCGTCRLAERMLQIIAAMRPSTRLWKLDANFAPHWLKSWEIESVPCLVVIEDGKPIAKRYRMESVVSLDHWLKENAGRQGESGSERDGNFD
jgi:thioredoxin-like negative regulator of GroEL